MNKSKIPDGIKESRIFKVLLLPSVFDFPLAQLQRVGGKKQNGVVTTLLEFDVGAFIEAKRKETTKDQIEMMDYTVGLNWFDLVL